MRFVSIVLILCHFILLIAEPALAFQRQQDMEVALVKRNTIICNTGGAHGITVGMLYNIHQSGIVIGKAEVKVVKENTCGLKITEMNQGYSPNIGDKLTLFYRLTSEQQTILSEMQESEFTPDKLTKKGAKYPRSLSDYYFSGQSAADNDYGSAFAGGFVAGFLGGLIGWGIGYAIVDSQGADVPSHYLADLNDIERLQFNGGYKEKIKSKRKSTFNTGALTGTALIVFAILLATNNS